MENILEAKRGGFGQWVLLLFVLLVSAWGIESCSNAKAEQIAAKKSAELAITMQSEQDRLQMNGLLNEVAAGDRSGMDLVETKCLLSVEDQGYINVSSDFKDPVKVRQYLRGLNPYDAKSKIGYVGLPEMNLDEMATEVASQVTKNRIQNSGNSSFIISVTFLSDGFSGLKNGWGIVKCNVSGRGISSSEIDVLYVE